jgi:hypothetical protein
MTGHVGFHAMIVRCFCRQAIAGIRTGRNDPSRSANEEIDSLGEEFGSAGW